MTNAGLRISPSVAAVLILNASAFADTLNVPGDLATIQECIDAAVSGVDECVVAPGVYNRHTRGNSNEWRKPTQTPLSLAPRRLCIAPKGAKK